MSPPRDKSFDVESARFSFQTVAIVVATALLVSGLRWVTDAPERTARDNDRAAQTSMQSDIRDMKTRMEAQSEMRKLEKDLLDAQLAAMRVAIDASGLRSSALAMSQELQKAQREKH